MRTHGTRWITLQSIFAFTALLAVATAHGQVNINVTAANSVNNNIYSVNFAAGSTIVLNTDQKSLFSVQSLVFIPNNDPNANPPIFTLDLLAADNQKGSILRYAGDFTGSPPSTVGTVVSTAIQYPTGLSVDAAGDLFVVNDAPGHSPQPQVWVLPANGPGGFGNAMLIDSTHFVALQATVETLLAGTAIAGDPTKCTSGPRPLVCPGDLLVLTSNPAAVLLYQGNGSGTGPLLPSGPTTTLISQCPSNPPAGNCIPIGTVPAGITVWPFDNNGMSNNSLLISTQSGPIQQYSFSGGSITQSTFYAGLPNTLYKIKTGYQGGLPRAFVVQSSGNHGSVFELGPQNVSTDPITLLGTVTAGVAAPRGIAVSNAAQALASSCQTGSGCNLLGGLVGGQVKNVLTHLVGGNIPGGSLQGNIVEDVCIVPTEPRKPGPNGACNDATVLVNQVCPGYDNTGRSLFIPGYLCAGPGGFALIKTLTTHAQNNQDNRGKFESEFNGTYVQNSEDTSQLLHGVSSSCQPGGAAFAGFAWAPLAGEGTIVEGSSMVDLPSGCGSGHNGTGYTSLWAIGLALDTTATELQAPLPMPLWNFAQTKYNNLKQTISNMTPSNITQNISTELVNTSYPLNSGIPGCIDQSLSNFVSGTTDPLPQQTADFQNAANLLSNIDIQFNTTCDYIVTNNPGSFTESSSPVVLNPSGQNRSRLANLYYTINTEILGNPATANWPPPVSISVSVSPQLVANTGATTVSWALNDSSVVPLTPCTLSSNDPTFNALYPPGSPQLSPTGSGSLPDGPWTAAGVSYSYTLTCPVPVGTVKTGNTMSVSTHLTIWPAVLVTTSAQSVTVGNSVLIDWTPPAAATGCTLISNGHGILSGTTTPSGPTPYVASYQAAQADVASGVTFTANCTAGASPGVASITVNAVSQAIVVSVSPSPVGDDGYPAQVTWTPPAGATGCTLSGNGRGALSGTLQVGGPATGAPNYATYRSTEADPTRNGGIVTFTATCTAGASPGSAHLTVRESP
jgi:hypothetical protein